MSYVKAENILPYELIEQIQDYIDGTSIYIPKKEENKSPWGAKTNTRLELEQRNVAIYKRYSQGKNYRILAAEFYLSEKSIQRIVLEQRRKDINKSE
ncbi:CD3324 family protein [Lachnoclostridium phytofermentans]|uniref:Mor transcription activator domain-containing protein n=1 Tax=Lachnoclostridium phytofermentans (strain ATCC 700394 / DSM 18823 / ISDg) TaxID=357809 RepID=A9KSN1_LACP7|nr:CD3324 family protein [Lachnoclostridium phytofermentans]ABX43683.1 conserved hypothetical protein [Lachnoclostridium phytofermentans ISDg]